MSGNGTDARAGRASARHDSAGEGGAGGHRMEQDGPIESIEAFYGAPAEPDGSSGLHGAAVEPDASLRFHIAAPERPAALLDRLGPPPAWSRPAPLRTFLTAVVEAAGRLALSLKPGRVGTRRRTRDGM